MQENIEPVMIGNSARVPFLNCRIARYHCRISGEPPAGDSTSACMHIRISDLFFWQGTDLTVVDNKGCASTRQQV